MLTHDKDNIGDAFERFVERARFPWAWVVIIAAIAYLIIHLIVWASVAAQHPGFLAKTPP